MYPDHYIQLCRYGDFTFAYDGNGRLQTRTNTATGQTLSLRYDAAGRLHQATNESGANVHYVNDALGRRIGRVVNGALERGWIYGSELAPIAEVNAAGQVTQTYVYASRPNVPDLIVQADGDVYRVVHDHLGSVRLVVNVATGVVVHQMRFDEWGVLVEESGDATIHPFGYAGGLYDRATGLTRFGARDYDPGTGRWTAKDPSRFSAGPNLYGFDSGDPVNMVDVNGRNPVLFLILLALVVVAEDDGGNQVSPYLPAMEIQSRYSRESFRSFPSDEQIGGSADAYRHCGASCEVTSRFGSGFAELCEDYNEWHPFTSPSQRETDMDLRNDAIGRDLGRLLPPQSCGPACRDALIRGRLDRMTREEVDESNAHYLGP